MIRLWFLLYFTSLQWARLIWRRDPGKTSMMHLSWNLTENRITSDRKLLPFFYLVRCFRHFFRGLQQTNESFCMFVSSSHLRWNIISNTLSFTRFPVGPFMITSLVCFMGTINNVKVCKETITLLLTLARRRLLPPQVHPSERSDKHVSGDDSDQHMFLFFLWQNPTDVS